MKTALVLLAVTLAVVLVACAGSRLPAPRFVPEQPGAPAANEPVPEPEPEPEPVSKKRIVITTGVHGNEPSGYLIQDQLAEMGFTVFGPCNPWGIANNKRHLEDGRDLNRIFANDDSDEVKAVKEFLADNPPDFLLDLHEDPDGKGAYLIQNGPDDDIGRKIVDALKDEFEFDPEPQFLVVKGEDGLLKPTLQVLRFMALGKIYGLAFHAWATYGCTAIVVECPGTWPEEKRKRYQLRVCETAKDLFEARD
jgi:hypothetical protein